MDRNVDSALQRRIAELETENTRLRDSLEFVKSERRELRERVYGPIVVDDAVIEAEFVEAMKNRGRGQRLGEFLSELGVLTNSR